MAKKIIAVIIGVLDAALLSVIIVSAATGWRTGSQVQHSAGIVQSTEARPQSTPTYAEEADVKHPPVPTAAQADTPTEAPAQTPTQAPVQAATEAPAQEATSLPYVDTIGAIKAEDFAWVYDALNGDIPALSKKLSGDELLGKWKAEFLFGDIWELVYITVEKSGSSAFVTIDPYLINYGEGWVDESNTAVNILKGQFDSKGFTVKGEVGEMTLYSFYEGDGVQYGIGRFDLTMGDNIPIGLVRP